MSECGENFQRTFENTARGFHDRGNGARHITGPQQDNAIGWPPIKVSTVQSLATGRRGYYLEMDLDTGALQLTRDSDAENSGTWWEIDHTMDYRSVRGYTTMLIRNRGNSPFNGHFLTSTGGDTLELSPREPSFGDSNRWIVRYAGFHNGYQAFYIQRNDMGFLTVNPDTGVLSVQRTLTAGAHWCIKRGPAIPTDRIR